MKKKIFFKKIIKIFFIIFLIFSLLNSCSPLASHAVDSSDILNAAWIDAKTRFTDTFNQTYDNLINLSPDWLWWATGKPIKRGGGRHRGSALADVLSVDVANSSSADSVSVSPVYTMYGKSRFEYTNGNYEILQTSITVSSNYNVVTGGTYSGIPNYTANDFGRSDSNLPTVGTWFIVRDAYNSSGEQLYSHNMAYSFDTMPRPIIYNDGRYGFSPSSTTGRYYSYDNHVYNLTINSNSVSFNVRSTNDITSRTGLSWDSKYEDYQFFTMDYSLNMIWYCSVVCSNNDEFNNTVDTRLTNNYNSYGINYKPSICKYGIDSRTVINNSNVNNYSGFETVNNNIVYNYDTYENYFIQHDEPQILNSIDLIYGSQPAPTESFTSPVRYNYPYLFSVPLSSDYLPSEWLDNYGSLDTHPNINIDDFLSVPTETFDVNLIQDMGVVASSGMDLLDVFGLASPFLALALLGVLFKFFD